MDTFKKLFAWLKTLPIWLRAIVLLLISALVIIASMSLSACGTTRAIVRSSDTAKTTITISTNNPIDVNADPTTTLDLGISTPKKEE